MPKPAFWVSGQRATPLCKERVDGKGAKDSEGRRKVMSDVKSAGVCQ